MPEVIFISSTLLIVGKPTMQLPLVQKGSLKAHCVLFIGLAAPGTRRILNKKREADASLGNFDFKGF